jgi:predicted Zn-dependent peptidase
MIKHLLKRTISFILISFCFQSSIAQQNISREDSLPLDHSIRYGTLKNGFTYYIKPLSGSYDRIQLSLYIKVGSNQQDKDQLDAAHALEHLAFQPTENFSKSIIDEELLNRFDMQFYDLYGSSGLFTEYDFDAPSNNDKALETGLLWFKDIASDLKFSKENIEKVRGELRQEFLGNVGSNMEASSIASKLNNSLFPGGEDNSNYLEYNKTFSYEVLKFFYKNWYRPNLMAISVIGKIKDVDTLEALITKTFSSLNSGTNSPKYKNDVLQYLERPRQFVKIKRNSYSTSEYKDKSVETNLIFRKPRFKHNSSWIEYKEEIMWDIFADILQHRLRGLGQRYKGSFKSTARFPFKKGQSPDIPGLVIEITSNESSEKQALQQTMEVVYQLRKFGVTKNEWAEFKTSQVSDSDGYNYWFHQIKNHYIYGEYLPENKNIRIKNWLTNLKMKTFNNKISNMFAEVPDDIGLVAPEGNQALKYTEEQVKNWIKVVLKKNIAPYQPSKIIENLFNQGQLEHLSEKEIKKIKTGVSGAKEIILENGLKIVLKPFQASTESNAIWVKGFSPLGASCFDEEDFYSAINAPNIVRNSGFGTMDKYAIKSFLSKTEILQEPISYVDYNETAIQGKASSLKDLEILLQMIYLNFVNPRKDKLAYEEWQKDEYQKYLNPVNSNIIFDDFSNGIRNITGDLTVSGEGIFGHKYLKGTEKFQGIHKTNFERAYEIYQKLYGQASDFTFLVSGDFSEKSVLPLLQKYLGNIPNNDYFVCSPKRMPGYNAKESPAFIKLPGKKDKYKMDGVYYYLGFLHNVANLKDWKEQIKVYALGWFVYQEVIKLRFKKGYTLYNFGSSGTFNKELSRYEIFIKLFAKEDELESLRVDCKQIFADIKSGYIDDNTFSSSTHRLYKVYSPNWTLRNREMQEKLYNHYRYGLPWINLEQVEDFVKSLTIKDIIETANKYCKTNNLIEVVMKD